MLEKIYDPDKSRLRTIIKIYNTFLLKSTSARKIG